MRDVCYHEHCDREAAPGKPFCSLHTNPAMERLSRCDSTPGDPFRVRHIGYAEIPAEDTGAEHSEVLAEIEEVVVEAVYQDGRIAEMYRELYDLDAQIEVLEKRRRTLIDDGEHLERMRRDILSGLSPDALQIVVEAGVVELEMKHSESILFRVEASNDGTPRLCKANMLKLGQS